MRKRICMHGSLTRLTALFLCVLMTVSFCTGCAHPEVESDSRPETNPDGSENQDSFAKNLGDPVNLDQIVDTFNIVVLMDNSSSILQSDPGKLAQNAPMILFESLFAKNADKDRPGSGIHSNVNVIPYNNISQPVNGQCVSLDEYSTIESLQTTLSEITTPDSDAYDTGLGEALKQGTALLDECKSKDESREKNLIILFTDGYSVPGRRQTAPDDFDSDLPFLGGDTQKPLEEALKTARERKYEIIVLGLDAAGSLGEYWEEFMKIANYTQLDYTEPMEGGKERGKHPAVDGESRAGEESLGNEETALDRESSGDREAAAGESAGNGVSTGNDEPEREDSENAAVVTEELSDMPLVNSRKKGGGLFKNTSNTKGSKVPFVNYYRVNKAVEVQRSFIQISCFLMGIETDTPKVGMDNGFNTYSYEVNEYGITAAVFYVLSSSLEKPVSEEKEAPILDSLINPDNEELIGELRDQSGGVETGSKMYENRNIRVSRYDGCVILTIFNPEPGEWRLKAHPRSGNQSQLYGFATQIGGLELELYFKQNSRYADESTIVVRAKKQGEYLDEKFYLSSSATVAIYPARSNATHLRNEKPDLWVIEERKAETAANIPLVEERMIYEAGIDGIDGMVYRHQAPFPGAYMVDASLQVSNASSNVSYFASGRVYYDARPGGETVEVPAGKRTKSIPVVLPGNWKESVSLQIEDYSWNHREKIDVKKDEKDDQVLEITRMEDGDVTLTVTVVCSPDNLPFQRRIEIKYPIQVLESKPGIINRILDYFFHMPHRD